MQKRNKFNQANTLFNYFDKTPPQGKNPNPKIVSDGSTGDTSINADTKTDGKKRERQATLSPVNSDPSSEDNRPQKSKKLRFFSTFLDESDSENMADNKLEKPKVNVSSERKLDDYKYDPNQSSISSSKIEPAPIDGPSTSQTKPSVTCETAAKTEEGEWAHCKLPWLKPQNIKDAQGRTPDNPEYDPSTLLVPIKFYKLLTPAQRQWWEMKASHYDCVLFFKVGKFYELYHMDAVIGVNELGFSYMKGEFAHSGFPESAYARMVYTLVLKGYKVARVEQTETPEMMQERCKTAKTNKKSKFDKVVRREICQVTLRGTQVCGMQDPGPDEPTATYMISISEEECQDCSTYGVCFIDTSIGVFNLGQFKDDKHSSRLLTTLAHYQPALIIYDRKTTTARTSCLLSTHCPSARREAINMWTPENTLKTLAEKYYKTNTEEDWPEGLKPFLHEGDVLGLTPAPNCFLAIKALGGCVSYLTNCLLDIQILTMSQFMSYEPPDVLNNTVSQEDKVVKKWEGGGTMVLDAMTLKNLRIVQAEGCLYDKLNFCVTPMGKRLLYQWVCAPSCNLTVIKERQEAVKELFENQKLCQTAKRILTSLPDLERLLAKVHTFGNSQRFLNHPDSRAIFYEDDTYNKRKVLDFMAVLNSFTKALQLTQSFSGVDAVLLKRLTQINLDGKFPDYRNTLQFFRDGFDQTKAEIEGRILPGEGVDEEYDVCLDLIKEIKDEFNRYLSKQEKFFRCRLSYVHSLKKKYLIEVPESVISMVSPNYKLEGARKGYKRYSTAESREMLFGLTTAEEQKGISLKGLSRRLFEKFSSHYNQWQAAVQCLAKLDVLLALAEFARQQTNDICLPTITFDKDRKAFVDIVDGRHPCIPIVNDFIPNDTELGVQPMNLLLLTGPNMGGKSTLMRQVGLITVLAHLGSYVTARKCNLSLVDRIFTRIGASDDILVGQSTFLVEMNETASILKHASIHSLVFIDELGRGTSTYDGTAIASAVCLELAERGCRVIFSTHFHSLVHHLTSNPGVSLGHMACMEETDETTLDSEDTIPEETITFLYKLTPGTCPKSYGFNAARLAGIPKEVTRRARKICINLEKGATCVHSFRAVLKQKDIPIQLKGLLKELYI